MSSHPYIVWIFKKLFKPFAAATGITIFNASMSTTTVFVTTSVAIALPWVYSLHRSPFLKWTTAVSFFLLLHTLMGLHTLLLHSPSNIFRALDIPLNTPTEKIRALLMQHSGLSYLSDEHEELLRRFASFDVRTIYARFGHNVLAMCTYCQSFEEFALYSLPRPIMSYIREIAFVGLITTRRRKMATTTLFVMALFEIYTLLTAELKKSPRERKESDFAIIWWHDYLLVFRHMFFIVFPLLIHFTPSFRIPFVSGPPLESVDTSAFLMQIHQTLSYLLPTIHLVKYTHAASMRVADLRARATAWWEEEAQVGEWVRHDGAADSPGVSNTSVHSVARALDLSFDRGTDGVTEGKLRTAADTMTKELFVNALKPLQQNQQ